MPDPRTLQSQVERSPITYSAAFHSQSARLLSDVQLAKLAQQQSEQQSKQSNGNTTTSALSRTLPSSFSSSSKPPDQPRSLANELLSDTPKVKSSAQNRPTRAFLATARGPLWRTPPVDKKKHHDLSSSQDTKATPQLSSSFSTSCLLR